MEGQAKLADEATVIAAPIILDGAIVLLMVTVTKERGTKDGRKQGVMVLTLV